MEETKNGAGQILPHINVKRELRGFTVFNQSPPIVTEYQLTLHEISVGDLRGCIVEIDSIFSGQQKCNP